MNYSLPLPTDELWRRTRPETFSFPRFLPSSSIGAFRKINGSRDGVYVMTMPEGRERFPALFTHIGNPPHANDLSRYAEEIAEDGFLVYVDPSVREADPIEISLELSDHPDCALGNIVAIAPGADVSLTESLSDPGGSQAFISTRILVGSRARLTYRRLWRWKRNVFSGCLITLSRDAHLNLTSLNRGEKVSKIEQSVTLSGRGAHLDELFVDLGTNRSHVDLALEINHGAPDTYSRAETRGVVRDRAYSLHHGLIRIFPEAKRADSYFNSKHLLLTDKGRADSIPKLEICTDEVKAGHGHTLSDVDSEAIYYIMTRGIPHKQAVEMYVDGFLAPMYERFPDLSDMLG